MNVLRNPIGIGTLGTASPTAQAAWSLKKLPCRAKKTL